MRNGERRDRERDGESEGQKRREGGRGNRGQIEKGGNMEQMRDMKGRWEGGWGRQAVGGIYNYTDLIYVLRTQFFR